MFLIYTNQCQATYISEAVSTSLRLGPTQRRLRSSDGTNYTTPRTRTEFGERAFSVAGPSVWNSFPEHIRSATNKHVLNVASRLIILTFISLRNLAFYWLCNAWPFRLVVGRAINNFNNNNKNNNAEMRFNVSALPNNCVITTKT